ncbi:MAG: glycosyltransferase family 2 protein [Pseudomonadota bacterium]
MTGKAPVSAFLITRDEEARLPATLAALGWVDEIVVVDSGSTDQTCALATAAGARVEHRAWTGYGAQKAHAEGLCRHDWVLNVDADEVVTGPLAAEITALVAGRAAPGAYRIRILNVYPGDRAPRPFANDYDVVRFYHRSAARYRDHPLFDRVALSDGEQPGRLSGVIHHFPYLSFGHFIAKENRYTDFVAQAAPARARLWLLLRLPLEMPVSFLKFYVWRRHVFGGWKGFVFALGASFMRLMRLVKLLEQREMRGPQGDGSRGKG